MDGASTGRSLACESCGSPLTLAQLGADAACPFCGYRQQSAALLRELRLYHRTAEANLDAAVRDRGYAADWGEWAKQGGGRRVALTYIFLFGTMIGISLVAIALFKLHVLSGRSIGIVSSAGSYVAVGAYIAFYYIRRHGRKVARPDVDEQVVACPSCGARGRLAVGQEAATCAYCGAALVPSRQAIARGLDTVREAARRARMERYRAERQGMANVMSRSGGGTTLVWMMVPFGLMLIFSCVSFTYRMASGETRFSPGIFVLWGIAFAAVGGAALLIHHRRAQRAAWRAAMAALARQFRGSVLPKLTDRVAWLNAYWAAEFPVKDIYQAYAGTAAALDAAGFPAMLMIDPVSVDQYRPQRLEIFMAAIVPGVSDAPAPLPPPVDRRLVDALGARGFTLEFTAAGYRAAQADPGMVRALHADPARARALAPAIAALANIAAAAGAEPAAPIP